MSALPTTLPQTLPQWLLHNAVQRPREVAQRHKREGVWKEFSWAAVCAEVRALARGLQARGVQPGQTVLLVSENRPELYWAEWAAMAIGAKAVALYPDATEAEIDYVVGDAQAVCVFAEDQEQVDKVLPVAARHPELHSIVWWEPGGLWSYRREGLLSWDALKAAASDATGATWFEQAVARGQGSDIALLSYTSGTTGAPKGVINTHATLLHNAALLTQTLQVPEHCEYLSYIPLSWATEQWVGVAIGLMRPMTVNFAERPDQIQEAIRELACDMVFFGPRQWESLAARVHAHMLDAPPWRQKLVDWGLRIGRAVRAEPEGGKAAPRPGWARALLPLADLLVLRPLRAQLGLKRADIAMTGGAAVAPDIFRLFAAMGVMLRNVYGCSEFGLISVHQGRRVDAETIGEPVPMGTAWGAPLQWRLGEGGALQVRGGTDFAGYWGKPEKSAEKMSGDWFETGDAVGATPDGSGLVYYDRVEHMSRLRGGHLFSKQFIEIRLRFSPYIREVMVIGDATRDHATALINIDGDVFARWAERHGVSFTTFTDLSQRPEVLAQVAAEVARVNRSLPEAARLKRFVNLPKELDADEGELTRTRKLKRDFIAERYRVLIEALYDGRPQASIEIPVRYQDGRSGLLRAEVATAQVPALA